MLIGQLDDTFEHILDNIMLNAAGVSVIDREERCVLEEIAYAAIVTYMRKPLEKTSCDARSQSLIVTQCVIIEIDGVKLPIFRSGEIFLSICMDATGITHPIRIRSMTAKRFFHFITGVLQSSQYVPCEIKECAL